MSSEKISRILLVDDDPAIRHALGTALQNAGFDIEEASRGEDALELIMIQTFDAVLLDINMPGIGGIRTLKRLRAFAPELPILMVTVCDEEETRVQALELGADDYITKPFSMRECVARVRSAVRRTQPDDTPILIGKFELRPVRRTLKKAGQLIRLTPKEYEILTCLILHAGRAVSYSTLLTSVWGTRYCQELDYLRTFVLQLRKKIEDDPSHPVYLVNDFGIGYRFNEIPESSS